MIKNETLLEELTAITSKLIELEEEIKVLHNRTSGQTGTLAKYGEKIYGLEKSIKELTTSTPVEAEKK